MKKKAIIFGIKGTKITTKENQPQRYDSDALIMKQVAGELTEKGFFVANLDNFIKAAEQRILNSIDLQYFRKNVSGTVTADNQYLAVPTDYLASFSLSVVNSSNKEFLLEKDVNYIQSVNPNSATTGVPKYYAYFDINNFILGIFELNVDF